MRFWGDGYDLRVNVTDWSELERSVAARLAAGRGFCLATLNLDHLVKLRSDVSFRKAYAAQDLITADGNPVVWLSRLAARPVELIPGSDAILPLVRIAAAQNKRIALVGSTDTALAAARDFLESRIPGACVVAAISPAMGFDPEGEDAEQLIEALQDAEADLVFIALGAPKQEVFAAHAARRLPRAGFASIGAGLDFFAGHQRRAPRWVRATAMEWLWRALSQPTRLVPRYARCFAILPAETLHALRLRFAQDEAKENPVQSNE
ncbi:WecB/TagA/CpsF family glycosyltransferase [Marivita sp. GX14005]|uniref:WecB/TagA/CpsF family glycosyltransferase n=1 Tax=Marivita sp. GX14005 TaxID=2942276 RepID=UPI00201921B4|nr:WecB/TagA/CpsF family glycosyltransferase [Marivita sp. GX14005]MCL3881777.1 WecB/TagA/CpsF family glycosyltransferase [Marivita sp. GX14005]